MFASRRFGRSCGICCTILSKQSSSQHSGMCIRSVGFQAVIFGMCIRFVV